MDWRLLTSENQIAEIINDSNMESNSGILVFKHSTRCSVSFFAKKTLQSNWDIDTETLPTYYLDLITYRDISAKLAETFNVAHESPQVMLINNGKCVYNASHANISVEAIKQHL